MLMNDLFINFEIAWRRSINALWPFDNVRIRARKERWRKPGPVAHQTIHKLHLRLQSAINMAAHGLDQDRGAGSNGELNWSIITDGSHGTN